MKSKGYSLLLVTATESDWLNCSLINFSDAFDTANKGLISMAVGRHKTRCKHACTTYQGRSLVVSSPTYFFMRVISINWGRFNTNGHGFSIFIARITLETPFQNPRYMPAYALWQLLALLLPYRGSTSPWRTVIWCDLNHTQWQWQWIIWREWQRYWRWFIRNIIPQQ